jgi:GAF domain-containing protein/HAMP domain-containing protein
MNSLTSQFVLQLIVWGIGLVQFILALYVFILNTRHPANRHISALFFLFSINSFALGVLLGAESIGEATLPAIILAPTSAIAGIAILLTAIILIKPSWILGRWRWAWRILYLVSIIPILLTIIALASDTRIWFTGLPENYAGGFIALAEYTAQELSPVRLIFLVGIPVFSLLPLFYLAFIDKTLTNQLKGLARLLFITQIAAIITQLLVGSALPQPFPLIITNTFYFLVYAFASFSQSVSGRRLQRGRLQNRLTALVLVISIPLLVFTSAYLFSQTSAQLRLDAVGRLKQASGSIASTVETWLDLNVKALGQMNTLPGIVSMNPNYQKPILESFDNAYTHMYLVSTTDPTGVNVARSDENDITDYSDRHWYQKAIQGEEVVFQTLIGRTSGEPAMVVSRPIFSNDKEILGVGMFASDLNEFSIEIANVKIGETVRAFIVDPQNQVVAHTNNEYANQVVDFSMHPAVSAMRNLEAENIRYNDQNGTSWIAYFQEVEYGWGVVVEQDESELLATLRNLQIGTWVAIFIGSLLLTVFTALAIRQAIQPIDSLTETATAITNGDLSRVAPVESYDEIGLLAQTFNRMTEQLLELIGNLEQRVAERTTDLESRSNQLEAATRVGQAASSILDVDELIETTVELIRDRFDLYYVGLFLVDELQEFAILRAGTGEAGQALLARQHMIRVGSGMIGWCVENGEPRIAMEVDEDSQRLATAELPHTRSEAAIPLRSRGQVIGAMTLQSIQPDAFDDSLIAVFQTMADLVGVAIDNARLYTETENALRSTQRVYSELTKEEWLRSLQSRPELSFRSDRRGVTSVTETWSSEMRQAWTDGTRVISEHNGTDENLQTLAIPIKVRGNVIGVVQTQKSEKIGKWTDDELAMLEIIIEQLGVALDSARLYEETQFQANSERMIGEISTKMRETLDIESVIQTAARELRNALNLAEVEIRMGSDDD